MRNKYFKIFIIPVFLGITFISKSQIINTIAGNGSGGFSGDGGQATAAEFSNPWGININASGNLYIADFSNNRVRVINTSGIISTMAGTSSSGYSGDGGQATAAELNEPASVAFDAAGNVYIADWGNLRVRVVNSSGVINTLAGNGLAGFSGDGGPATAAELNHPVGLAIDANNNLFIADQTNNRIRKISTSGIITTYAGTGAGGFSGDAGQATAAKIDDPLAVAVDNSGNVYIADCLNSRVRVVNTSGIITTIAGNGTNSFSGDGGPATAAELSEPTGVGVDAGGNVFIVDETSNRLRVVSSSGIINTYAGDGSSGFSGDGGPATAAELSAPCEMTIDASGNVIFDDRSNERMREVGSLITGLTAINAVSQVSIYPNPASGYCNVTGLTGGQKVEVYDYMGQKISTAVAENSTMQLDISSLSNGIYLVRISGKDNSIISTAKLVKD